MIKFFRSIRQQLLTQNRLSKYAFYAVGEIVLVVIGILIALSINNWNEKNIAHKKECRYLNDLVQDLKKDSVSLRDLKNDLDKAAQSKRLIEDFLDGLVSQIDSVPYHIDNQWDPSLEFIPNSVTMDELKSSSSLDIIANPVLRRQIVNLYNKYDQLLVMYELGSVKNQKLLDLASQQVKSIFNMSVSDGIDLLNNTYFTNSIRANYVYSMKQVTNDVFTNCVMVMEALEQELKLKNND